MRMAERMRDLGTETAFEAAARARALEATGVDVIHLEIGEPDFDTPPNVVAASGHSTPVGRTTGRRSAARAAMPSPPT